MARKRVRAAERKSRARTVHEEAHTIADGVYHIAREVLEGVPREQLPLPVYAFAPLTYAMEMIAAVVCKQRGWDEKRHAQVSLYLLTGVQEVTVAAFSGFDETHFEAWVAASDSQVAGEEVASG